MRGPGIGAGVGRITDELIKSETGEFDVEIAKWLSLPGKGLTSMEGLSSCVSLLTLDLSRNSIREIRGLEALVSLQRLDLSRNIIQSIGTGLKSMKELEYLDLRNNQISNVDEIRMLQGLSKLRQLHFSDNPATQHPTYHLIVAEKLPQLSILDGESVALRQSMADAYLEDEAELQSNMRVTEMLPLEPWFNKLEAWSSLDEGTTLNQTSVLAAIAKFSDLMDECQDLASKHSRRGSAF